MTKLTSSQRIADELSADLRARKKLLWIVTKEEARVEGYLFEAAASAGYAAYFWDVAQGVTELSGRGVNIGDRDPGLMLEAILNRARNGKERNVFIMRDLPAWLTGPAGVTTLRSLCNFCRFNSPRESGQAVIVISPSANVPDEISGVATVIDWPLPDRDEIGEILDLAVEPYTAEQIEKPTNGTRDAAIEAAIGLAGEEAKGTFQRSLVQFRKIDPASVAQEKKRVIAREKILEWYDPLPLGLDAVGGLENLKDYLVSRASAYSPKARNYGLPVPRGSFLAGISGCGKSLICKAIATAWGFPLIRVDLNALKSKFVGESEQQIRRLFRILEAIGRCVVWLDEIEKSLQGATSGSADGGVSADALGAFLTWMQERKSEAYVIATANDISNLPPELLRKGRFDEIWWVDLPTSSERAQIAQAAMRQHNRSEKIDAVAVATATDNFTGSEIAALVPDALFAAFNDKARAVTTQDLLNAAKTVVPLADTAKEKIEKMRKDMAGRARPATKIEDRVSEKKLRVLDI